MKKPKTIFKGTFADFKRFMKNPGSPKIPVETLQENDLKNIRRNGQSDNNFIS